MKGQTSMSKADGIRIRISANRTRGLWVYEIYGLHNPYRASGRLSREASNHTLLSAALTAALVSIDETIRKRLSDKSGDKLNVTVTTSDAMFATALQARMEGLKNPNDGFRVGRHFVLPLYKQLVRFNVMLNVSTYHPVFESMRQWAASVTEAVAASAFTPEFVQQLQ
jgi:hypothetical protein